MSLPRVPVPPNFLPTIRQAQTGAQGSSSEDPIVVDVPPSSKFTIAWSAEAQAPVQPLPVVVERSAQLSSSEGEADISEEEISAPLKKPPRVEEYDETDFVTPTNHLNLDENPMDQAGPVHPLPRLSRAFSMPLPSQLGSLQNPRRKSTSSSDPRTPPEPPTPVDGGFHDLSLELADSVQMVIQTLLQLSPPQVLDPAKEQFSACSLSIPTPSISAMFTAMKSLNYMSANMSALSVDPPKLFSTEPNPSALICAEMKDFDVGEMLQSVGDALSGVAAQAGVDLVLFHSDVGMKHIAVKGDECGIQYALSHIVRQVVCVAYSGDTIEIGLHIDVDTLPETPTIKRQSSSSSPTGLEGSIRCSFQITHRFGSAEGLAPSKRSPPSYKSLILRRLMRHVGASLEVDEHPGEVPTGNSCKITITLDPGSPSVVNPSTPLTPQDAAYLGLPEYLIAQEPTLNQLNQFAETLRGKRATLYANAKGSFAHHLSSYLTAWGMDVSHVALGGDADADPREDGPASSAQSSNGDSLSAGPFIGPLPQPQPLPSPTVSASRSNSEGLSFILIDDDVDVLRSRLHKMRTDQAYPLHLQARNKRPSLASNHRPRSSPQVARVMGLPQTTVAQTSATVVVHFTSLANFKLVKEAIQSSLIPVHGSTFRVPEVLVIPKPAGPRRFLTALHTAVTKPIVDPFFAPIATSPISPGIHSMSPFIGMANAPRSPSGRSTASARSDRSNRSPKEYVEASHGSTPPVGADNLGYFPNTSYKMGASPSGGLLISSPNGPPTGIFFVPKKSGAPPSPLMERDRPRDVDGRNRSTSFRVPQTNEDGGVGRVNPFFPSGVNIPEASRSRFPLPSTSPNPDPKGKGKATTVSTAEPSPISSNDQSPAVPDTLPASAEPTPSPAAPPRISSRRSSQQSGSPPASPVRFTTALPHARRMARKITPENAMAGQSATAVPKKKGKGGENHIVPPISVLIVDDNPINRTILSTFMRKKRIKYDVANNGEEAVQKWRSGTFHLILMDIQMPVMDGIQATKEIRRIEKQNAGGFPSTPQSEGQRTPSEASTDSRSASTPHYRSSVIIVALTASSLQADRVAALAAGCNDFLTKPVSLEWLNNKIIEWGSIKALQMWADIRPEVARGFTTGQAAQAQNVARRLHVPEGRSTPTIPRSRSPTHVTRSTVAELPSFIMQAGDPRSTLASNSPSPEETIGGPPRSSSERPRSPVPTLQVQPPSTDGLADAQRPFESPVVVPPPMAAGRRGTSEMGGERPKEEVVEGSSGQEKNDCDPSIPEASTGDPSGGAPEPQ